MILNYFFGILVVPATAAFQVVQFESCRHRVTLQAQCSAAEAARVVGDDATSEEGVWVRTGGEEVPEAVARLRKDGTIDHLRISFPKEQHERAKRAIGACIDEIVALWDGEFEDLRAAATPLTAPELEMRGFLELEDPDLTALARDEPIVTHAARLPAAVLAYARLGDFDIVEKLRSQTPRDPLPHGPSRRDPWAGVGTTFF